MAPVIRWVAVMIVVVGGQALAGPKAAPPTRVILSAELEQPGGRESLSLKLNEKESELAVNSNLSEGVAERARLGLFTAPTSELLRADLAAFSVEALRRARLKNLAPTPPPIQGSRHRMRYRIDGVEVDPGDVVFQQLERTFALIWKTAEWKPKTAVEVSYEKGGRNLRIEVQGRPRVKPPATLIADAACRPLSLTSVRCRIPGFGYAFLRRP